MCRKHGFTLVEVLFVVLIAAGVLAFAVPAYKKVQERSKYEAALGTLLDISNAVNSLKQDLRSSTGQLVVFSDTYVQYGGGSWPSDFAPADADAGKPWNEIVVSQSGANIAKAFTWALMKFGYLKPLQNTAEYDFYILEPNHPNSSLSKCSLGSGQPKGTACMFRKGTEDGYLNSTNSADCYAGAVVLPDGTVKRLKNAGCK